MAAGSPADEAGLEPGERIVAVNGVAMQSWLDVRDVISTHPGQELELTVDRRDGRADRLRRPGAGGRERRAHRQDGRRRRVPGPAGGASPRSCPGRWREMGALLKGSLVGMKDFAVNFGDFTGNLVSEDPSSNRPVSVVGLVEVGGDVGRDSAANLLFLIAAFNVFVGVFNLLPLLPLDGGHAAIATYERIRSRRGQRVRGRHGEAPAVTYAVVMFLVFLGLASLYLDIRFGIDVGSYRPAEMSPAWSSGPGRPLADWPGEHRASGDPSGPRRGRPRRRRRTGVGAVDDDHEDGGRRRHAGADLRPGRRRCRHRALHLQRRGGRRGAGPHRAPLAGAARRRHPLPVQAGAGGPRGRRPLPAAQPRQHPQARPHPGRRHRGQGPQRARPHRRERRARSIPTSGSGTA